MEREHPARLLQHGPVLGTKGAAGAARSIGFCTKGLRLHIQASRMLAVHLVGLLHQRVALVETGEQDARGPFGCAPRTKKPDARGVVGLFEKDGSSLLVQGVFECFCRLELSHRRCFNLHFFAS
jgi:hypothetical protein